MTVKELAQFTGKSETTVQRWVKKANCKMQLCNNMNAGGRLIHTAFLFSKNCLRCDHE